MKIRSITIFADLGRDRSAAWLPNAVVDALGAFAHTARQAYEDAGFEVQTTRLATGVFPALWHSAWGTRPIEFVKTFEALCHKAGFEYIALGPVSAERLDVVPALLEATRATFFSTHIVMPKTGVIDGNVVRGAARVISQAADIEEGFGNLRFAALANVPACTPFFPAAYYEYGSPAFAIATEAADLAVEACAAQNASLARERLTKALENYASRIVAVAEEITKTQPLAVGREMTFRGIDFSLAPFPTQDISIGAALERLTGQPLGAAGTLAAAGLLTDAIDRAEFPHTGFCGLMLPVLEDSVLAQRAAEGRLRVSDLLHWSAVCGTGLDTVPLPGDVDIDALTGLLFDVAALSSRLCKPLTARLMPLPGKAAGDSVHFDFAYFAPGGVLALDHSPGAPSRLMQTAELPLGRHRSSVA
jgi:hypothetical protein